MVIAVLYCQPSKKLDRMLSVRKRAKNAVIVPTGQNQMALQVNGVTRLTTSYRLTPTLGHTKLVLTRQDFTNVAGSLHDTSHSA